MYHHYDCNYVELSVFSFYFQFTREKIRMMSSIYDGDIFAKNGNFSTDQNCTSELVMSKNSLPDQ